MTMNLEDTGTCPLCNQATMAGIEHRCATYKHTVEVNGTEYEYELYEKDPESAARRAMDDYIGDRDVQDNEELEAYVSVEGDENVYEFTAYVNVSITYELHEV